MKQTVLTFTTKVNPTRVGDLQALLDEMGNDVENNPYLPFTRLKLLHFASLVLNVDENFGAYLVFENNFDGELDDFLDDLYLHASEGLHRIYSCCSDYHAKSGADRAHILSYLRAHVLRPNASYIGNVGRSVVRTKQEGSLRDRLEDFIDELVRTGQNREPPSSIRQKIQTFVKSQPIFAWANRAEPRQTAMEKFIPFLRIGIVVAIALFLLPILIPIALVWVIVLRRKEKSDPTRADFGDQQQQHVRDLVKGEDHPSIVQNHLSSMFLVKPGLFRRLTLWVTLWGVNLLAQISTHGNLNGIASIHFAHWSLIDKGRRLLFVSNFDGSWESYLDEFIDKAHLGLTGVWSNTVGFPRARFLVLDGATDGTRFKAWARDTQIYTNVWYSAYKQLTVQTIDNNSGIREDMFTSLDETATRAWLWRF